MSRFVSYLIIILAVLLHAGDSKAQTMLPESIPGDTVVTSILPAVAYVSDLGVIGAAMYHRHRYHPLAIPYRSFTEMRVQASTKGLLEFRLIYDQTETFGSSVRSRWMLYGERQPLDYYFGLGNSTTLDSDKWKENYYQYLVYRGRLEWGGRRALIRSGNSGGILNVTAAAVVHYEIPDDDDERLMGLERPEGIDGGWVSMIGAGLLWENRDSELAATRGNRFDIGVKWAPGYFTGDYPMVFFNVDVRQYFTLPVPWLRPVLALRTTANLTDGTVPYWERPHLGDERTLRGYPLYRFRGDASVLYNIELRSWIYEYEPLRFRLGIHGFHDSGRVFYTGDSLQDLFQDYHRTFGGGIAFSLYSPEFILRLDAGFSEDMYRLYMNIGYMF